MLPCGLAEESLRFATATVDSELNMMASALFGTGALVLGVLWFVLAAACGLAVVRDTAAGCDKIENWPDMAFFDWMLEPLYVFGSACLALLPTAGLMCWFESSREMTFALALGGLFFLFPILLLTTLENGSPFAAVSLPVYRTFVTAWKGWVRFYLLSAAMLTVSAVLVLKTFSVSVLWGMIVGVTALALVWLFYFRLLGRLAWYCTDHSMVFLPEEEASERDSDLDAVRRLDGERPPRAANRRLGQGRAEDGNRSPPTAPRPASRARLGPPARWYPPAARIGRITYTCFRTQRSLA